jgi:3-hydroxyisobutyrate dehydrogenase
MSATTTIGFVGVGNMGLPMAARLIGAGFAVRAFDASPERLAAFTRDTGGQAARNLAELAGGSGMVITMLPDSAAVGQVLFGEGDNLSAAMKPGGVVIDMTSGVPARTMEFGRRLEAVGVQMIDAPVSGGVARARTGELSIMAGGEAAVIARCDPVLRAMGTTITRIGGLGAGQAMKALNNLVSAGGFLIGIEALLIGKKFGLDPGLMTDVLNASTGMNNSTQKKFKQFVLADNFASGFGLDLMVKDLSIALEVGREGGVSTPFAVLCREMWAAGAAALGGGQDHTALAKFSELLARVKLTEK